MDAIVITYLGQSCFLLEFQSTKLLLDPGKTSLGRLTADIVYATHRHFDHTRGIEEFLDFNEASILISNEQVTTSYSKWGDRVKTIKDGDTYDTSDYQLEFIAARHGLFRGEINLGIIVRTPSFSFGHLGDGVAFEGFYDKKLTMLAVPIAGILTASPKGAINELKNFKHPLPFIIPMHWF
jgi:L-ascorbate metabolism protein UlaG (beta-lactamase superfamily)